MTQMHSAIRARSTGGDVLRVQYCCCLFITTGRQVDSHPGSSDRSGQSAGCTINSASSRWQGVDYMPEATNRTAVDQLCALHCGCGEASRAE
jgi:hypothetical protein